MSDMLSHAITNGPVSLLKYCRSLDRARRREIAVPRLPFTEPITTLAGAAT